MAVQQVMQAQGHQDSLAAQVAQMRAAAKTFASTPSQPRALSTCKPITGLCLHNLFCNVPTHLIHLAVSYTELQLPS